jgi:two-component system chemotaxis family response regulator WspR
VRVLAGAAAGAILASLLAAWHIRSLRAGEQRLLALVDERTADLEERKRQLQVANELLQHLATIDDLTNLANARRFKVVLAREWQCARRAQQSISLLMIDVDLFKRFNDALGHQRGDECLVRVAGVLRQTASRANDLAARYGGEEFVLLLPHTHADGARGIAEAVRAGVEALKIPHPDSSASQYVTVSVGIATAAPTPDGNATDDLVGAADRALYDAKNAGRNRCAGPLTK